MTITASQLDRLLRCPSSHSLPRVHSETEHATRGTVIHRFLEEANLHGREEALANVPEDFADVCAAIDLERLPLNLTPELALAYDVATDTARTLGRGLGRDYGDLGPFEIAMTCDLAGVGDGRVVACDYKAGFMDVPSASESAQLKVAALALSRIHGIDDALVSIIRIRPDGGTWTDWAEIGLFDLDSFAQRLRRLHKEVAEARATMARGTLPDFNEGAHCRYCPAALSCPAKTALIKRMASGTEFVELELLKPMSPDTAGIAYERLRSAKVMLKRIEDAVMAALSEFGELPLPSGNVLRRVTTEGNERLDGDAVYDLIRREYGQEVADAATKRTATKTALKDALRAVLEPGQKLSALEREVLDKIREAGGATRKPSTKLEEVPRGGKEAA